MIANCPQCAQVLLSSEAFCTRCGTAVTAAAQASMAAAQGFYGYGCSTCGGDGRTLPADKKFCVECRWLRPLSPNYELPVEAFIWSFDAQAMAVLRGIGPLNAAANALSDRVSRPWLEASINGIRLGPDQLPDMFEAAVDAARALALPRMPEIYISGEQMWECLTLGSDQQAFVVIGSLLTNLKGVDLRFLLGREMGHVAAGHALWKSVMQFVSGRQANRTIMGQGVLQFLNPAKLVESAIDAPLMAWARHSEITADRAGALATGDHTAARRVTTQCSLKSFPLFNRINMEALERDIATSDDRQMAISEWTMSSTPYLARRLRLLDDYFASDTLRGWRAIIDHWTKVVAPPPKPEPPDPNAVRLSCVACGHRMKLSKTDLEGKEQAKVRCPNAKCGKLLEITPKPPDKAEVKRIVPPPPAGVRVTCPACSGSMIVPAAAMAGKEEINVRCPGQSCRKVLTVRRPPSAPAPAAPPPNPAPRPEETVE